MTEKNDHSQRAHALLSASSAHRWLECPPSAAAAEAYPNEGTEFTREGTLAHEIAELVASGREKPENIETGHDSKGNPVDVTAEMVEHAKAYRDYIQEQIKRPDAVVLLEQRVDFSPWVPGGFGTCDCIIIQGNTMTVIDYKYGVGVPVAAKDNPQMLLYALGALNDYGFLYDVETIETHVYQPRIDNISAATLTITDLMLWSEKIKPIAAKAAKGKGDFKAGTHCRFCPHAGRCRELRNVCTDYVNAHGLRVKIPVLAPHEVAEALQMEPLISLWLKRVKDQALTSLLNGELIPGWKVVEGKMGNRKWSDELKVLDTLIQAGYKSEDVTETSLLTPAAMDKAIGKKKAAELLSGLIDRAPGSPTVVPYSDKRPAYDRTAETLNDLNN